MKKVLFIGYWSKNGKRERCEVVILKDLELQQHIIEHTGFITLKIIEVKENNWGDKELRKELRKKVMKDGNNN